LYGLSESRRDLAEAERFLESVLPHKKHPRWMRLDNAAKIYPAALRKNWSNVFRVSATFSEPIRPEVMQTALDITARRFPSIAVRLRRGVFWYYLEEIDHAPDLQPEKSHPLVHMPLDDIRKCAFRVLYYQNRVAVEFFHALTDGNGGLVFLKTLIAEYLYQRHGIKIPAGGGFLDRLEEPSEEELEDSFFKYAGKTKASRSDTDAFKITGRREADGFKTNTTFILDADTVVAEAKRRGVTVTAYTVAALMTAAMRVQQKRVRRLSKRKPVKVLIPVNLRRLFPSKTLRNFVLYATPGVDPRLGEYEFDELCAIVSGQMQLQITQKNMAAMIATNVGSEKPFILRAAPLFIKNTVMKMVFNAVGERKSCFSFSNLGVVKAPDAFCEHVERLDFVLGVQASAPYNTSAITYGGKMYLNVIRNIAEPVLERELCGVLTELGLCPTVESNTRGKEN
jgi:NRPS condensation-like uncharacterized protein